MAPSLRLFGQLGGDGLAELLVAGVGLECDAQLLGLQLELSARRGGVVGGVVLLVSRGRLHQLGGDGLVGGGVKAEESYYVVNNAPTKGEVEVSYARQNQINNGIQAHSTKTNSNQFQLKYTHALDENLSASIGSSFNMGQRNSAGAGDSQISGMGDLNLGIKAGKVFDALTMVYGADLGISPGSARNSYTLRDQNNQIIRENEEYMANRNLILGIWRCIGHATTSKRRYFHQEGPNENLDLRLSFIQNHISVDVFKAELERRDKTKTKRMEIYQVMDTLSIVGIEAIKKYQNNDGDDAQEVLVTEMLQLKDFINQSFLNLKKRFGTSMPNIDDKWDFKAPRVIL
jgi:hypothetical protein